MDVFCADKTGTLTMNHLALTGTLPQPGFTDGEVIRDGALASHEADQDPIDLAVLQAARERAARLNWVDSSDASRGLRNPPLTVRRRWRATTDRRESTDHAGSLHMFGWWRRNEHEDWRPGATK